MAQKEQKQKKDAGKGKLLELPVPGEVLAGRYTNFALLRYTPNEFVFDFFLRFSEEDINLVSRILTSPEHAQALLNTLKRNIENYEKKFGPIKERKAKKKN